MYKRQINNEKKLHGSDEESAPPNDISIHTPAPCFFEKSKYNTKVSENKVQQPSRNLDNFQRLQKKKREFIATNSRIKDSYLQPRSGAVTTATLKGAHALMKATSNNLHSIFKGFSSMGYSAKEDSRYRKDFKESSTTNTLTLPSPVFNSPLCTPIRVVDRMGRTDGISNIPTNIAGLEIKFTSPGQLTSNHLYGTEPLHITKYSLKCLRSYGSQERINTLVNMANAGKILLSSILLPETPLLSNAGKEVITDDLHDIYSELHLHYNETTPLLLLTTRFLSHSLSIQRYKNPRIFTQVYVDLVKLITDPKLIPMISNNSITILTLLFEILLKFCMASWKFPMSEHKVLDRKLIEWQVKPIVLNKVEICKLILNLLKFNVLTDSLLNMLNLIADKKDDDLIKLFQDRSNDFSSMPAIRGKLSNFIDRRSFVNPSQTISCSRSKRVFMKSSLPGSLYKPGRTKKEKQNSSCNK